MSLSSEKKTKDNWFIRHKILTGILILVLLGSITSALGGDPNDSQQSGSVPPSATTSNEEPEKPTEEPKKPSVPVEYLSALSQADTYANSMHMSKSKLYEQLVSEYGGQFTPAAAKYAVDNVKADWNANALAMAKNYQETMHLSPAAIRDQLVSEYGEKFTPAEADYAIKNLNK